MEPNAGKVQAADRWKTAAGLTDEDLKNEATVISNTGGTTLTQWADQAIPNKSPIHFLRANIALDDYSIVSSGGGSEGALSRTWYIEFAYDWKGGWGSASLKPLITETLSSFACYWQGTDGNLWRISECWLDHYATKHWAYLTCVNTVVPEAKPIYDKMEAIFQETLQKDQIFH